MTNNAESLDPKNNLEQPSNQQLQIVKDLIPVIDFEAVEKFYSEVEMIVKQMFQLGYHYGPPYEVKPGKEAPANILYKKGVQLFIDRIQLLFEDEIEVIDEVSQHKTFTCRSKMFRLGSNSVLSSGEGSCSTDEGRFSYQAFEKIVTRHVRESAILRAHKDCIERFFNVSRFFPNEKKPPAQKPQPKPEPKPKPAEKKQSKWNPTPPERNTPDWFLNKIKELTSRDEITEFHEQFELDEAFFNDEDRNKIKEAYNNKWKELKK
jgi:hypothetical protein